MLRCSKVARRRALPYVCADANTRITGRLVRQIHSSDPRPIGSFFGFGGKDKQEDGGLVNKGKDFFNFLSNAPKPTVAGPEPKLPPHLTSPPPPKAPTKAAPAAPSAPPKTAAPAPEPITPAFVLSPAFVPPKPSPAPPKAASENASPASSALKAAPRSQVNAQPTFTPPVPPPASSRQIRISAVRSQIRTPTRGGAPVSPNVVKPSPHVAAAPPVVERPTLRIHRASTVRPNPTGPVAFSRDDRRTPAAAAGGAAVPPTTFKAERSMLQSHARSGTNVQSSSPAPVQGAPLANRQSTIQQSPVSSPVPPRMPIQDQTNINMQNRAAAMAGVPMPSQARPTPEALRAARLAGLPVGDQYASQASQESYRAASFAGNPMAEFMKPVQSPRAAALSGNPMAEFMKPAQSSRAAAALSGNPMAEFMKPDPPPRPAAPSSQTSPLESWTVSNPSSTLSSRPAAAEERRDITDLLNQPVISSTPGRPRFTEERTPSVKSDSSGVHILSGSQEFKQEPLRQDPSGRPSIFGGFPSNPGQPPKPMPTPVTFSAFAENVARQNSVVEEKPKSGWGNIAVGPVRQTENYEAPPARTRPNPAYQHPHYQAQAPSEYAPPTFSVPRNNSTPDYGRAQSSYSAPSFQPSFQQSGPPPNPRSSGPNIRRETTQQPSFHMTGTKIHHTGAIGVSRGVERVEPWQQMQGQPSGAPRIGWNDGGLGGRRPDYSSQKPAPPAQRQQRPAPAPVPSNTSSHTADYNNAMDAFGSLEDLMGGMDDSVVVSAKGSDDRVIEQQAPAKVWDDSAYTPTYMRSETTEASEDEPDRFSKYTDQSQGPTKWGKAQKQRVGGDKDKFIMDFSAISVEEQAMAAKAARVKKKAAKRKREFIPLYLPEFISVEHLAATLRVPTNEFVEKMRQLGFENVSNDEVLNAETAGLIAMEYNYELVVDRSSEDDLVPRPPPEEGAILPPRPPVVTIMGHVDHGKTTLLDFLRKSSIAAGEHGGITQHIGAFSVKLSSDKIITFLDTPGHAAFLSMRQRGANVTDIVILVVAADDSVMPQTLEAIRHARSAGVPMIVAINKMDKPDANSERVKMDLGRHGVEVEDFGGDTQAVEVSGKTGLGMEALEEAILTLSEMQDHHAEQEGLCEGWVIEASKEKRGRVATILVKRGTLKPGDIIVAGKTWSRVRSLRDEAGNNVTEAKPGYAVEVDGWRDQPEAGDIALGAENEARARNVVSLREEREERLRAQKDMEAVNEARRIAREEREAAEAATLAAKKAKADGTEVPEEAPVEKKFKIQEVPFIIKADVSGSAEAVINSISGIGNEMIRTKILRSGIGSVTEFDIDHAAAAKGFVIAFNVNIDNDIKDYARQHKVEIIDNNIIYRLENDIKAKLEAMLPPIIQMRDLGLADIMQVFHIKGKGQATSNVAGVKVRNGSITRNGKVKVTRGDKVVYDGKFSSLKHLKQDVQEMRKGGECGLSFDNWQSFLAGDVIQCYETFEQARKL